MKKIIRHLRNQPEDVRRQVAYIITAVLGIVLVLLWVVSLGQ